MAGLNRLPAPFGAWIDRSKPVAFTFESKHIEGFDSRDDFLDFMRRHHAYAVMRADDYRDVSSELGAGAGIVGEWDSFQARLKDVIAHRPLPKLVLVYNHCQP